MVKIPKYSDLNGNDLFKAMKLAYDNADAYYYEAELLFQMQRFGHSLSLSALGLEELGKSVFGK